MKKVALLVLGLCVLIVGVSCILFFWKDVAGLFKGLIGGILVVGGLAMMSVARD
ncbi:MAG: hypothetical protein P9M12_07400 [Candidatus Aceula lacicola]|nr:hypothetical protein [Candidatus Aceula lacicola]